MMKRRGEEYQLFWRDDRADFVRLAAKFDALIVPFAAVGADDAYKLFLVHAPTPSARACIRGRSHTDFTRFLGRPSYLGANICVQSHREIRPHAYAWQCLLSSSSR